MYSKSIKISDDIGNYIIYKISSNNLDIINSYSEDNFSIKVMTDNDLQEKLLLQKTQSENNIIEEKDAFIFDERNLITIYTEIIEEHINDKYVTYEITEQWIAPNGYEDKGFDWHPMDKTTKNYASLTNNRCCWSIYYSFDIWEGSNVSRIEDNIKLKGKTTNSRIGRSYGASDQAQLHIKYRKEKHYSFYYYD